MVQLPVGIVPLKMKTMDVVREERGAGGILIVQGVIILLLLLLQVLLLIMADVQCVHQLVKPVVAHALIQESQQTAGVLLEGIYSQKDK
jgi:hypothetical protein